VAVLAGLAGIRKGELPGGEHELGGGPQTRHRLSVGDSDIEVRAIGKQGPSYRASA
jgi:hypothetical protein